MNNINFIWARDVQYSTMTLEPHGSFRQYYGECNTVLWFHIQNQQIEACLKLKSNYIETKAF